MCASVIDHPEHDVTNTAALLAADAPARDTRPGFARRLGRFGN